MSAPDPATIEPAPATRPFRVLVVEADPIIAELYVDAVRTRVREARIDAIGLDDAGAAEALLAADVAVCSAGARPESALDTLNRVLLLRPELPVIVLLPGCAAGNGLQQAIEQGAADVLLRTHGYLDQLPVTVRRVVMHARGVGFADARHRGLRTALAGIREENQTLQQLIDRLESMALTDSLTGLLNRRALDAALTRVFAASKRYGHELSCLVIDADGFKAVNDELGHARGDELIKLIASGIVAEFRQSDIAARPGGDEFVVLLPHTGPREAAAVAQRLRARFAREAASLCGDCRHGPTLTVGVSSRIGSGVTTAETLLAAADQALYAGKRGGRDCVITASATESPLAARAA